MRRNAATILCVSLVLAMASIADAQQANRTQRDQDRQRSANSRQAQQQRQQQRRDGQGRQQARSPEMRAYRAGLVAGYMLGYADGLDDYVLIVGTPGQDRPGTARRGEQDEFRSQLRNRARQEMSRQRQRQTPRDSATRHSRQPQRISGEIVAMKRVHLRNDQQRHLVVLIETPQGSRRIADLGPVQQLQQLDLQEGDRITVQGNFLPTREGTPVLNARRVQSQGRSVAIRAQGERRM